MQKWKKSSQNFHSNAGFSKFTGALDYTNVKIILPGGNITELRIERNFLYLISYRWTRIERVHIKDNVLVGNKETNCT